MAGTPAAIGHDRSRTLHYRLPIGVGHVGDQNVALLDPVHLGGGGDQAHLALRDLLADGAAARQHPRWGVEPVAAQPLRVLPGLRFHCLRPRLQDVELAVDTIAPPFDIHRTAIMSLDDQRIARQLRGFRVGDRKATLVLERHIDGGDGTPCRSIAEDHFVRLGTALLAQDRGPAGRDVRFVQIKLVGIHGTLNDGLTQAISGGDEYHLVES